MDERGCLARCALCWTFSISARQLNGSAGDLRNQRGLLIFNPASKALNSKVITLIVHQKALFGP
jgi:hypothetical protein